MKIKYVSNYFLNYDIITNIEANKHCFTDNNEKLNLSVSDT